MPAVSKHEKQIAKALRARGVWFRQQVQVGSDDKLGSWRRVVDFLLKSKNGDESFAVVEIDDTKYSGGMNAKLRALGYTVLRFTNADIDADADAVISQIMTAVNPIDDREMRRRAAAELAEVRRMLYPDETKLETRLPS